MTGGTLVWLQVVFLIVTHSFDTSPNKPSEIEDGMVRGSLSNLWPCWTSIWLKMLFFFLMRVTLTRSHTCTLNIGFHWSFFRVWSWQLVYSCIVMGYVNHKNWIQQQTWNEMLHEPVCIAVSVHCVVIITKPLTWSEYGLEHWEQNSFKPPTRVNGNMLLTLGWWHWKSRSTDIRPAFHCF